MNRVRRSVLAGVLTVLVGGLGGCTGDAPDSRPVDSAAQCTQDASCDDGVFCNGTERCAPSDTGADARGCVMGVRPCSDFENCDETARECRPRCETPMDSDRDGHVAASCGGDDCDDSDPLRYPGATEICDVDNRDEDCDPRTLGFRDLDDDGFASATCCNVDVNGFLACGGDCDDMNPNVYPGNTEACDTLDNDCDERTDEGVLQTFYEDRDNDRYGRMGTDVATMEACFRPVGFADNQDDCDDADGSVSPAAQEICDATMIDENCSGAANEACECNNGETVTCAEGSGALGVCGEGVQDCVDGRLAGCTIRPREEICQVGFYDDDCNGRDDIEEGLTIVCYPDDDDDGYAPADSNPVPQCPVSGRPARGGCPLGFTDRSPAIAWDCDDQRRETYTGAIEICDGIDSDCSTGGGVALDEDGDGDEHTPLGAPCIAEGEPGATFGAFPRDDCDDAQALIHGGFTAEEDYAMCDGLDNDCDPATQELTASCSGGGYCADGGTCGRGRAIIQLAAGSDHSCALRGDGTVACWGENGDSQIGDGTTQDRWIPTPVPGLIDVIQVAAGGFHTCALVRDGTVKCWGQGIYGQLGDGSGSTRPRPTDVPGLSGVVELAGGGAHTCARLRDGTAQCWGLNFWGQLGDGGTTPRLRPNPVPAVDGVTQIVAGAGHTCARLSDESTLCWGANDKGQVGDLSFDDRWSPTPVPEAAGAVDLIAGGEHTCALLEDGTVMCWGRGQEGQIADEGFVGQTQPTAVSAFGEVVDLARGTNHTCARLADETVSCWGFQSDGQGTNTATPTPVGEITGVLEVVGGGDHSCARLRDGTVWCWGRNWSGQIGVGVTGNVSAPTRVDELGGAVQLVTTEYHTCARMANGSVQCWGGGVNDSDGVLGAGATVPGVSPQPVAGISDVVELAAAGNTVCGLIADGGVVCWGSSGAGLIDSQPFGSSQPPTDIAGITTAVRLVAGSSHACVLLEDQTVMCWGDNGSGQLGDPANPPDFRSFDPIPKRVPNMTGVVDLWASGDMTFARLADDTMMAWGFGPFGDGTNPVATSEPRPISALASASELGISYMNACARWGLDRIECWGENRQGQLGDGTISTTARWSPSPVPGLSSVEELGAGGRHNLIRLADGTLVAWGSNGDGQIGDGTAGEDRPSPTPVSEVVDAVHVEGGPMHSCAIRADGMVFCWGANDRGQLGVGDLTPRLVPSTVWGL